MATHKINNETDRRQVVTNEIKKPDPKNPTFPSNSNREEYSKIRNEKKPETTKIVSGKAVKKKKSLMNKIVSTFVDEDVENVKEYVIFDVLVPAFKNTVSEVISTGVDMILFGDSNRNNKTNHMRRDGGRSYVSYQKCYDQNGRRDNNRREPLRINRNGYQFDNILIDNRSDAEDVMSAMVERVDLYGVATVADLFGYIGISTNYTDHKYGWDNLSMGGVRRVRDGYLLDLPEPILVD